MHLELILYVVCIRSLCWICCTCPSRLILLHFEPISGSEVLIYILCNRDPLTSGFWFASGIEEPKEIRRRGKVRWGIYGYFNGYFFPEVLPGAGCASRLKVTSTVKVLLLT